MSDTPLRDALAQVGTGADLLVQDDQTAGGPTVTGTAGVQLGKGVAVRGAVQWARDAWAWAVGVSWRPKGR